MYLAAPYIFGNRDVVVGLGLIVLVVAAAVVGFLEAEAGQAVGTDVGVVCLGEEHVLLIVHREDALLVDENVVFGLVQLKLVVF